MRTIRTNEIELDEVRSSVRGHYGKVATRTRGCGCGPSCCTTDEKPPSEGRSADEMAHSLGYSTAETSRVPEGANLGLGCGNPLAIASLQAGQTVLDLGSGAGFDAFLASTAVGSSGFVIGVDMTPEMVSKARQNKAKGNYTNVEFRLGEIENLPVADGSVDIIISNCVINLSPDKAQVFREAFRVLKPGGRLAISDILATAPLPESIRKDLELLAGCVAGASLIEDVRDLLRKAGFSDIRVQPKGGDGRSIGDCFPGHKVGQYVTSAIIEAHK